jgi:Ca2+-binding RTX toxin-like protein
LIASAGSDVLDGGAGTDVADYTNIGSVVTLQAFDTLKKGIFVDKLTGIETVIGSNLLGDTIDLSSAVNGVGFTVTSTNTDLSAGFARIDGSLFQLPLQINIKNFENVSGSIYSDYIAGNSSNNFINGGIGIDTMVGGLGDDIYVVDNASDIVKEADAAGTDLVQSSITYALVANLENLTLTGAGNINGKGNTLSNVITGNTGSNLLDGGKGGDTMTGGLGDDIYVVDNVLDIVKEAYAEGIDLVQSSITYAFPHCQESCPLGQNRQPGGHRRP